MKKKSDITLLKKDWSEKKEKETLKYTWKV